MWECPVCHLLTKQVVSHHDHFGDVCVSLLRRIYADPLPRCLGEGERWETFERLDICLVCNQICAEVKGRNRTLPEFVSFSPDEMELLRTEERVTLFHGGESWVTRSDRLPGIWAHKKEQYRVHFRALLGMGVTRSDIQEAWVKRLPYVNQARLNRQYLSALMKGQPELEALCEQRGQYWAIAEHLRRLGWGHRAANTLIFWYQSKHGDPGCRKNFIGCGPSIFARWFCTLACGDVLEARDLWIHAQRDAVRRKRDGRSLRNLPA